jgi:hypothetical protein
MRGYRGTHPGLAFIPHSQLPSVPFRAKFFFTLAILLILGLDIAIAYGLYRLVQAIFL